MRHLPITLPNEISSFFEQKRDFGVEFAEILNGKLVEIDLV